MINKAPFIYKYKLPQKRIKIQVLRKEDSRLVEDRQTFNQFFFAQAQIPWNTGQTRLSPELTGWSKVTTTYSIWIVLTWGRL